MSDVPDLSVAPSSAVRATAAAVAMTSSAVLPIYLTGALAVQLQSALRFDTVGTGAAVSAFFATSALVSPVTGRIVDRTGWRRSAQLSALLSGIALFAISIMVRSWLALLVAMALGGIAHAVAMPAANLALVSEVAPHRRGLAFGVKHMAIPIAGLLAGISVPLVALNIGWRWAYGIGLMMPVITLVVIAATGREQPGTLPDMPDMPRTRAVRGQIADVPAMFGLAAAGGLAAGAVGALSAFFVESAVRGGTAEGLAGAWFAVGSAVGLAVRPAVGWLSDRRSGSSLRGTAALLGMGAVGFAMLAVRSGPILPVATVIAFGAGWGWPGLYHHAVVDHNPDAAAAATGVALVGLSLGGAFGPSLFGLLAHNASFESAWLATALVALTAAGLAEATRLRFRRAPGTHPTYETIE